MLLSHRGRRERRVHRSPIRNLPIFASESDIVRPAEVADRITFSHFADLFESRIRDNVTKTQVPHYSLPSASVCSRSMPLDPLLPLHPNFSSYVCIFISIMIIIFISIEIYLIKELNFIFIFVFLVPKRVADFFEENSFPTGYTILFDKLIACLFY